MPFIQFILGLSLGVGFFFWKQYQTDRQLRGMLDFLSDETAELASLPVLSLVRREVSRIFQTKEQLQLQLQTWQQILEIAPIGYLLLDEDNQLIWCNQKARELLTMDSWRSGTVRLLLEFVLSYELDRAIERTRKSQQTQVIEWQFYSPKTNGKRTPLLLKATCFPLPQQEVGVFLENQQPLVELSQSRHRAFADLAHELRTPLTSISLVAETLQSRLENPERSWVERMLKETQRLIELVQNWLDISRLQENPQEQLQYQSIKIEELIFSAWETLQPLAQQKEVELNYFGHECVELEADRDRLTQVLLNLLDNSIKHSPVRGKIRVEVETDRPKTGELTINIIDSGSGFAAADLPHIFQRLYRGDPSRTRQSSDLSHPETLPRDGGSGLGLAIVQQIIKAHGGSITAQNHPETGGAWLKIVLPLE